MQGKIVSSYEATADKFKVSAFKPPTYSKHIALEIRSATALSVTLSPEEANLLAHYLNEALEYVYEGE